MYVHLKQSGELLASQSVPGDIWTPPGVVASAEKVASVFRDRESLSIDGLMLVSGAGNIVRGSELKAKGIGGNKTDVLGRLATVANTIVLSEALSERGIPNKVFIAENMGIKDPGISDGYIEPYDTEAVKAAYDKERVVLVAGGTGEDGKTTDNAVLEYARRFQLGYPSDEILVLKGTKHDGVYDADPATNARARRFSTISAGHMISHYERYPVVDEASLITVQMSALSLRVYADGKHDLQTVLRGAEVGTMIIPGYSEPVL